MDQQQDIRNLSLPELKQFCESAGEKPFRAVQIFEWIYKKGAGTFDAMRNLPPALRTRLERAFVLEPLRLAEQVVSKDGTIKFLFRLSDGQNIEAVFIPTRDRGTACVSSQAGCKFACRFCASAIGGWARNLSCAEIMAQVLAIQAEARRKKKNLTHVVFMGTGEPLDNYEPVLKAVRLLNAPDGLGIGARRITLSTCGLVPGIERLAQEGLQLELSISLHGYDDRVRDTLMPVNRKYPLAMLIAACRDYVRRTNRQITFEYVLIRDLTVTPQAALGLKRLLKGLLCKLNLIPYNEVPEYRWSAPSPFEIREFKAALDQAGIHATVRRARGDDAAAACGQLRHLHGKNPIPKFSFREGGG